jgi:hypothetical protein
MNSPSLLNDSAQRQQLYAHLAFHGYLEKRRGELIGPGLA